MTEPPEPNGPPWPSGTPHTGPASGNVQSLRPPGLVPPETHAAALERLVDAMWMTVSGNRAAMPVFRVAFRTALAAASGGPSAAVEKILGAHAKRLDTLVAALPNPPPPDAA